MTYARQKAALTRVLNSGNKAKLVAVCRKAVREWNENAWWPDGWSDWQRALDDALGVHAPRLDELG